VKKKKKKKKKKTTMHTGSLTLLEKGEVMSDEAL
jgi:hypothetical protein